MTSVSAEAPLVLRRGVRLTDDPVRGVAALLYPEGVLLLNDTAAAVVRRCDGHRGVAAIVAHLVGCYEGVDAASVHALVDDLVDRRLLAAAGDSVRAGTPVTSALADPRLPDQPAARAPVPVGLLAELTYRCPLRCTYCSNPVEAAGPADELTTEEWVRTLEQARRLGVLQLHLSGGEPLLRRDLAELVRHASALGLYTNLITSGLPLTEAGLWQLVEAGLDHVQLSIQDADAARADAVAGVRAHAKKIEVAAQIRRAGLPLTVNVVLHAGNIDRLTAMAGLALDLGADRIELAHTQYYGWALRNRAALMPTADQVARAAREAAKFRATHGGVEIVYVTPDYHERRPKPCMNGWGSRQLVVTPTGDVLPCLAAGTLPDLAMANVRDTPLHDIWYDSAAFQAFRGTAWMRPPCRECPLREVDHGGCRCQAYALTGDAAATDPVCELSPHHDLVSAMVGTHANGPRPVPVPRRLR